MSNSATPLVLNNGSSDSSSWDSANQYVNVKTPNEYFNMLTADKAMSNSAWANIANFFTGYKDVMEREYNNYLLANERNYELSKINDARQFDLYRDQHKYQFAVKDLLNAGLNPWLAVQNGLSGSSFSNSSGSSASQSSSSSTSLYRKNKDSSEGNSFLTSVLTTAIKVAALVALKSPVK